MIDLKYLHLECQGRSVEFYYDPDDFYNESGVAHIHSNDNNLPANHPVRISNIMVFGLSPVLIIIGYIVIFWWDYIVKILIV